MKKLSFLIIFITGIITTSCLDIVEDISLNKDGSGTYTMTMDMSEMMSMMQGFMSSEDDKSGDAFGKIDSSMQEMANTLRDLDGITNVSHRSENFKFKVSYDFANVNALNESVKNNAFASAGGLGGGEMMGDMMPSSPAYEWTKKTFERVDPPVDELLDMAAQDDEEMAQAMDMAKMLMGEASFTSVYHFPGKIKKMENEGATLSDDKKTATLEVSFLDILEGKANMGNKITFKKR